MSHGARRRKETLATKGTQEITEITESAFGTVSTEGRPYITLTLTDLKFDAIDHSCVYSVNGTVEYEILGNDVEE